MSAPASTPAPGYRGRSGRRTARVSLVLAVVALALAVPLPPVAFLAGVFAVIDGAIATSRGMRAHVRHPYLGAASAAAGAFGAVVAVVTGSGLLG